MQNGVWRLQGISGGAAGPTWAERLDRHMQEQVRRITLELCGRIPPDTTLEDVSRGRTRFWSNDTRSLLTLVVEGADYGWLLSNALPVYGDLIRFCAEHPDPVGYLEAMRLARIGGRAA